MQGIGGRNGNVELLDADPGLKLKLAYAALLPFAAFSTDAGC